MTWWHRLLRRKKMEEQLERELRFHIDSYSTDLIARGVDPEEARRQSLIAVGGREQVKEQCRDARGTRWLEDFLQDFRYGVRTLLRKPGFTAVALLTLALGIGASTAIFSAINPILFEPLPYPHANRVMMIWYPTDDGHRGMQSFGTYRELAARNRSFEAMAVFKSWQPTMTGPAEPERFEGQMVSAGYFRALGVPLTLGRDFQPSEDELRGPRVVILGDALWHRRFDGDPTIVGRQITLDAESYTVLGVMPRNFENVLAPSAELWTLLQYDTTLPADGREWGHHLSLVGRLRPGIGTDQARTELDRIAQAPTPEYTRQTGSSMSHGLIVNRLQDEVTAGVRPALLAILGAVTLLLMIACVNVTNFLLARGAERRAELAMRAALGASRTRTVRQLVTESLILAILGGVLGMIVAEFGVGGLVALAPAELPRVNSIGFNGPVFLFAAGLTTLIGLGVGLIPALNASRANLHIGMQQASWRTAGGHQLTRQTLVVVEVALALVLLVGAGLMLRSLTRLFAVSPGFNGSNLLTMQVQTYGQREAARRQFFAEALEAVRRVPGVTAAAFTAELPLGGDTGALETYAAEYERAPNSEPARADALRYAVTPGYFETMGIPLRRGRLFNEYDKAGAAVRPVVISESYANRVWPGQDPIGRRLRLGGPPGRPWDIVVGVVGDVKQASLAASQSDAVYVNTGQWLWADNSMWLVARGKGDVAAVSPDIKKAIWSVDKDQPIVRVATMDRLFAESAAERRFVLILFELFSAAALVLAATGIYGLLSGNVTERMREIGIRSALGATRRSIVVLVVRQGLTLTALGVAIGLVGAVSATSAIVALLFKVTRLDPITYAGVIALLAGAAAVSCWVPAWRAARVEPSITLRAD